MRSRERLIRPAVPYNNFAAPTPACTTCYLTTDYLGSVRIVTDPKANVVACHDYLPFGEEILAGQAGRGSQWGVGSPVNQKFTGQIRDQETNLDYFGARYYGGAQGRFNSPDDPFADQDPSDPQSWNLYSYVRNNPLNAIDPSGNDCITTSDQSDTRVTVTIASGACDGNKGVYIPGTVDTSSLSYNGSSIGYSYTPNDSNSIAGTGTVALGPSRGGGGDINPFGLAVIQAVGQRSSAMYGMMGAFAGGSVIAGAGGAILYGAVSGGSALTAVSIPLGTLPPAVSNPTLRNIVEELFQLTDQLPGGTAGAVRYERLTGDLLSPAGHFMKAEQSIKALTNLLKSGNLSFNDQITTRQLIQELSDALKTEPRR